ncbi:MAG: hypothetical protein ACJ8F7_10995 [Gemmataceae bacterium]
MAPRLPEPMPEVTVEFYGLPRHRAGRADLSVPARTAGDALRRVAEACPDLNLLAGGALAAPYLLSVDGKRFVADLDELIRPGERLLLLSADAGG